MSKWITKRHVVTITLLSTFSLDQFLKFWVAARWPSGFEATDGFSPPFYLVRTLNRAAIFGWMGDWPEPLRLAVFCLAFVLASALALSLYRGLALGEWLSAFALGCVVGGSLSNVVDRLRLGGSVDLFRFSLWSDANASNFALNLADLFIGVGVGILVFELVVGEGNRRALGLQGRLDSEALSSTRPRAEGRTPEEKNTDS